MARSTRNQDFEQRRSRRGQHNYEYGEMPESARAEEMSSILKEDTSEKAEGQTVSQYFKLGNPLFPQELDWAVTFSKFNFPWNDIAFGHFSAKDCFIKYTSTVREARVFFKKILLSQEKYRKYVEDCLDEPPRFVVQESFGSGDGTESASDRYCICKG